MPIGRLEQGLAKKHHGFRSPRRVSLPAQTLSVPSSTGFTQLQGQAVYDGVAHRLVLTMTATRAPGNLGPGILKRESLEGWHRHQVSSGEARRFLESRLEGLAERLEARTYPERGMLLEVCVPSGRDPAQFIQSTCIGCRCWYCELSTACPG